MPNGTGDVTQIAELLSVPLESMITALGRGIGQAQSELDRHSIEIQRIIDEDPVLAQYGLSATWYQIPSAQMELKVAIAADQPAPPPPAAPGEVPLPATDVVGGVLRPALPRMWLQPVNARYANQFAYDVNAASTVTLSIVPVPPPGPAAAGRPNLNADAALEVADSVLDHTEDNARVGRVTINFNPGARAWYVLQTDETTTPVTLLHLVRIDDETSEITRQLPEPT